MTGGNARHNPVVTNIVAALRARLCGTPCAFYGTDPGVQTVGEQVRFRDALITCARFADTAALAPEARFVLEGVRPPSRRTDRIVKLDDDAGIASMRRYVIVEFRFPDALQLHRMNAGDARTANGGTARSPRRFRYKIRSSADTIGWRRRRSTSRNRPGRAGGVPGIGRGVAALMLAAVLEAARSQ